MVVVVVVIGGGVVAVIVVVFRSFVRSFVRCCFAHKNTSKMVSRRGRCNCRDSTKK